MGPYSMNRQNTSQAGFSLIELMLALVAGLIVSSAVLAFTMSSFKSNGEYVTSTHLTQELRNTLNLITRELRRAGYDEDALGYLAKGSGSPFTHLALGLPSSGTFQCVIYAYDRAGGTPGTVELANREVRGIRWASRTVANRTVGVIEYAESAAGVQPACDGAAPSYSSNPAVCDAGSGWCPLTDGTSIDISAFTLTDNRAVTGTSPNQVQVRDIEINLTGRPAGTTEYTRSVKNSVRVRSECFDTTIANCSNSPQP